MRYHLFQPIRVVCDKSGKFPQIIGAEGFVSEILPEDNEYEYALVLPTVPTPEDGFWSADGDEMEPIRLIEPPVMAEEVLA